MCTPCPCINGGHHLRLVPVERILRGDASERVARLASAHEDRVLVVVVGQAHLLGEGDVVARSGVTGLVVAPALNTRLRSARDGLRVRPDARFLVSEAGIWFPVELR